MKLSSIRFLFSLLIVLAATDVLAQVNKAVTFKSGDPSPAGVSAFLNSFDSIDALLDGLTQLNLIEPNEKAAVLQVLKQNKIPSSTKLVQGKMNGKRITWGGKFLTIEGSGVFKTPDGTLLKVDKFPSFDVAFSETLRAVSNKKYTSLFEILINSANAGLAVDAFEAVSAAAYFGTYHATKTFSTALTAMGAVAMNLAGFPLEYTLVGLRNLIYKGSVECLKSGGYTVHGGYQNIEWRKEFDEYKNLAESHNKNDKDFDTVFVNYSSNLAGAFMAGGNLIGSAFSPEKAPETPISIDLLNKLLPNGEIPPCTKENAAKVESSLKAQAKRIEGQIQNGLRRPIPGAISKPASSAR